MNIRNQNDFEIELQDKNLKVDCKTLSNNLRKDKMDISEKMEKFKANYWNDTFFINLCNYSMYKFRILFKLKLNEKERKIQDIENTYIQDFDISSILKTIFQIENIKEVLFDEKQKLLFNVISQNSQRNQEKDIIKYFEEKIKNSRFTEMDLRLWELFQK